MTTLTIDGIAIEGGRRIGLMKVEYGHEDKELTSTKYRTQTALVQGEQGQYWLTNSSCKGDKE
jgi:hypothetical protein